MVKILQTKFKVDPTLANIILIIVSCCIIIYYIKKLKLCGIFKKKDVDLTVIHKEEKLVPNIVKKVKFKKEKKTEIKNKTTHIDIDLKSISSILEKNENVSIIQNNKKIDIEFLSNLERDNFYAIIGLIIDFTIKQEEIYSVEYLYELKINSNDVIDNEVMNCKIKNTIADNYSDLKYLLDLYIESLKNNIRLKPDTFSYLIIVFLKFEAYNYAYYMMCEMENYNYKIPRIYVEYLMNMESPLKIIQNNLKKNFKAVKNESESISKKISKYDGYIYYISKKDNYKVFNLIKSLDILKINIKPCILVKEKKIKTVINKLETNKNLLENTSLQNTSRSINEYIPKRYKLVSKKL